VWPCNLLITKLVYELVDTSGVTPVRQGWTNVRGLWGLGGPKPDPIFVYFNIQVLGVSRLFYSTADFFCERPLRISSLFCV